MIETEDDDRAPELSAEGKLSLVAKELMWDQDMDPREILAAVERVFGREKARTRSYDLLRDGFHRAFRSEVPFISASIYIRNVRKIYPRIEIDLSRTAIRMFKNMIMEQGSTGVALRSEPEYRAAQQAYFDAFRIYPPKTANVFAVLVHDRNCMRKLSASPEYFQRIVEIFSFVEPLGVETLRADLVAQYQQEVDRLGGADEPAGQKASAPAKVDKIRRRIAVIRDTTRY